MSSQSSTLPTRSGAPVTPLSKKIERIILDRRQGEPPRDIFTRRIWPILEDDYETMVQMLVNYCRDQLDKQGIAAEVDGRVKSLTSIEKSLERREAHRMRHQCKKYQNLKEIFDDIHDLAGVRIVVDYPSDRHKATRFIQETFRQMKEPNVFSSNREVDRLWKAWFGAYQSWNHRVSLKPEAPGVLQPYHSVMFEIQLTTFPERLYNKLAHPLLYKKSSGDISRKDEMVIDLSHGLALCYSLCVSYMQDKLGSSKGPSEQKRLCDTLKKAMPTSQLDDSEVDMDVLAEMVPNIATGSNLKSLASFGETIPVEGLLSALGTPPEGCCSTEDVWEQMINKLESVIQDVNQTPLNLPIVENARYHSEDVQGSPKCHDRTRTVVRSTIHSWATDTDAETLCWLHAPAGTGKSTLARTLADEFHIAQELAAGYFFKRGDKVRNSTARIFPTIASQLVEVIPRFGRLLRDSLERSQGTIETTSLEQQFNILLRTPLSELRPPKGGKPTKVIIIDALDECDFHQHIHRVLKLFSLLGDLGALRLCVIFTSRFAPLIADAFGVIQRGGTRCRTVALHEEFYEETKADIEAVLRDSLADIKKNAMIEEEPWPEDEEVKYVVIQATTPSPLFIYITTLIRFISGERGLNDPVERFKTWLERCRGNESPLDHLYRTIVEDLLGRPDDTGSSETLLSKEKSNLSEVLGSAVLLAVPLPAGAWAALLDMRSAKHWLRNLHAVISVPANDQAPVEIIHKSFSDFLLGNELPDTNPFKVDVSETHHMLARRCMDRMGRSSKGLRKNICDLDGPAMLKHDILEGTIAECIPDDLEYACLYWVHHLLGSKKCVHEGEVYPFLERHFLYWLEVLSIVGKLPDGGVAIRQLLKVALSQESQPRASSPLSEFLKDAERFILEYGSMIEKNPLQVYGSALVLSPSGSRVRQLFYDTKLACVQNVKGGPTDWDPQLQTFMAGDEFEAFAISQDGQMMAVATLSTLGLWDVGTGIFQQEFTETGRSHTLSFLRDGKHLASISEKGEVQLWDTTTGIASTQCILVGCGDLQYSALLPDHSLVATVACDGSYEVDLWDFQGDTRRLRLKHHTHVGYVALSPDGRTVASVAGGESIWLWSTETGRVCCEPLELSGLINAVAFSPNGTLLASASSREICLWNTTTGTRQHTLRSQMLGYVRSIAFFPAGDRLAVCDGASVAVWDIPTWINQQTHWQAPPSCQSVEAIASNLFDPDRFPRDVMANTRYGPIHDPGSIETLALSPDQKTLASSSMRRPLLLWDIETGTLSHDLLKPDRLMQKMAFSPDGETLAAVSYDCDHKELHLELFEVTKGSPLWHHKDSADGIPTMAFSPDGDTLAVVLEKREGPWKFGRVQLWEVATRKHQWHHDSTEGVQAIAFSPDGKTLAVASGRAVELLRVADRTVRGKLDCTPHLPKPFLSGMAFSSNGEILEIAPCFEDWVLLWYVVTDHVRTLDTNSEEYFKLMLPRARMSVRVPWINYASKAILQIPPRYESYKTTGASSRVVMGKVDGEFIVLDFNPLLSNDI